MDVSGIVYIIENAQQFWSGAFRLLHQRALDEAFLHPSNDAYS
jgi:hypothetical protein